MLGHQRGWRIQLIRTRVLLLMVPFQRSGGYWIHWSRRRSIGWWEWDNISSVHRCWGIEQLVHNDVLHLICWSLTVITFIRRLRGIGVRIRSAVQETGMSFTIWCLWAYSWSQCHCSLVLKLPDLDQEGEILNVFWWKNRTETIRKWQNRGTFHHCTLNILYKWRNFFARFARSKLHKVHKISSLR